MEQSISQQSSTSFTKDDLTFIQKPYNETYHYDMIKMAAVEPISFYPRRHLVKAFYHQKIKMNQLSKYVYTQAQKKLDHNQIEWQYNHSLSHQKNNDKAKIEISSTNNEKKLLSPNTSNTNSINDEKSSIFNFENKELKSSLNNNNNNNTHRNSNENKNYLNNNSENEKDKEILKGICKVYLEPNFIHSTLVNQSPSIKIVLAKKLNHPVNHYQNHITSEFKRPSFTTAEVNLFNHLLATTGKNFTKIAKEFQKKATSVVIEIPSTSQNIFFETNKIKIENNKLNDHNNYNNNNKLSNSNTNEILTSKKRKIEESKKEIDEIEIGQQKSISSTHLPINCKKIKKMDSSIPSLSSQVIPSSIEKHLQIINSTPINSTTSTNDSHTKLLIYNFHEELKNSKIVNMNEDTKDHLNKKSILPSKDFISDNKTKEVTQQPLTQDDMIFPRKVNELVHFYYLKKFTLSTWQHHNNIKIEKKKIARNNLRKTTKQQKKMN